MRVSDCCTRKEKLKSRWAQLEALAGSDKRLKLIAADLVAHFERRTEAMQGKGMVVCMSRRICVALYNELVALRPEWHSEDDEMGGLKVVMTGSASDSLEFQPHIRSKARREALAVRFRSPADEAMALRDDVDFFQSVRAVILKRAAGERKSERNWTTPFARSSPRPSSPTRSWTSLRRPA
jgi:hypothetical protein